MSDQLVTFTDSLHYRYFKFILNFWGIKNPPESMSLCPYFWTMVIFSLLTVVAFPLVLMGWAIATTSRKLYTQADSAGWDTTKGIMQAFHLDRFYTDQEKIYQSPGSAFGFTAIIVAAVVAMIVSTIFLVSMFIFNINTVLYYTGLGFYYAGVCLMYGSLFIGAFAFLISAVFGGALVWTAYGIYYLATNAWIWYVVISYCSLLMSLVLLLSACAITLMSVISLIPVLVHSPTLNSLFLSKNLDLSNEEVDDYDLVDTGRPKPKPNPLFIRRRKVGEPTKLMQMMDWVGIKVKNIIDKYIRKTIPTRYVFKNHGKRVISAFGVIVESVKSIKQGVCPKMVFLDKHILKDCHQIINLNNDLHSEINMITDQLNSFGTKMDINKIINMKIDQFIDSFDIDDNYKNLRNSVYSKFIASTPLSWMDDKFQFPLTIRKLAAEFILDVRSFKNFKQELINIQIQLRE